MRIMLGASTPARMDYLCVRNRISVRPDSPSGLSASRLAIGRQHGNQARYRTMRHPIKWLFFLVFAALWPGAAPDRILASDIYWTNTAGGNWTTSANWSPNQVPGTNDNALIVSNGTYTVTVNANTTVSNVTAGAVLGTQTLAIPSATLTVNGTGLLDTNATLSLSGGTVAGNGTLTLNGQLNWTSGNLTGHAVATFGSNSVVNITGSNPTFVRIVGRTVNNFGSVTLTGGAFALDGGLEAVFNNQTGATFQVLGPAEIGSSNNI